MDDERTLEESPEGVIEHFIVGPSCWPKRLRWAFYATLPASLPLYVIAWLVVAAVAAITYYGARVRM